MHVTNDNRGGLAPCPDLLISPPTNDDLIALAKRCGSGLKDTRSFAGACDELNSAKDADSLLRHQDSSLEAQY